MKRKSFASKKPRRSWYQLQLKSLLIFVFLFVVVGFLLRGTVNQYFFLRWVKTNGGIIEHVSLGMFDSVIPLEFKEIHKVYFPPGTNLASLDRLKHCSELFELRIEESNVDDYSALEELRKLRHVDLSGSNIRDITPFSKLKNICCLNIAKTDVSDLAPLTNLSRLKELDISKTRVKDLSAVSEIVTRGSSINLKASEEQVFRLIAIDPKLMVIRVGKSDAAGKRYLPDIHDWKVSF